MSKPRSSSGSWRDRQERDPYVQQARRDGWRSRAVYKLEQIADKEAFLRPDMTCIDLGAAPGGWSQYVTERLKGRTRKAVDQPRSMYLAELALDLARNTLGRKGSFVCKLFQGEGTDAFIADARRMFGRVKATKPKASRAGSSEIYLVARNYQL